MKNIITTDDKGRKYSVLIDDEAHEDMAIVLGPPNIVDELELPEPFATRLHNVLCDRGLLTYNDIAKNQKSVIGALQDALSIDANRITEAYLNYEKET
jgi:predicted flap endonuclease-1-like 5' DNA nuclease